MHGVAYTKYVTAISLRIGFHDLYFMKNACVVVPENLSAAKLQFD